MRSDRLFFALIILSLAAGVANAAGHIDAWTQITPQGTEVRAAVAGDACPVLDVDGTPQPMSLRAAADADFPVRLCQALVPEHAKAVRVDGQPVPAPVTQPRRILIFGDTGCRLKGQAVQDCNDPRAWPFALIARHAASRHPDLVIHVGDYYYRETPCPAGDAGCAGSPYGDRWPTWKSEFFDPAAPLLATTPWVFVRGNHESCSRGGPGWFRLLDAAEQPQTCPASSAPYRLGLGDLNLYILDSADTEDTDAPAAAVAAFSAQLDALQPDLASHPGWILTHRPFWGLTPVARLGPLGPLEIALNKTEQVAVRGHDLSAVSMVVSGHIHHFAAYTFGPNRPAQLIAGTGGDVGEPADTPRMRAESAQIDSMDARGFSFDRFGYLMLERRGADWVGDFRDIDDRLIAVCRLRGRALACGPTMRR